MNNVRCLRCDSHDVGLYVYNSHYSCNKCRWYMCVRDYNHIMKKASQKALEEALEES